jgi:hypothetical protein
MKRTPLKRKKPLARKKNGLPRKPPGGATGRSLTRVVTMMARQAVLEECGHACMAAGRYGVECAPRVVRGVVWPFLESCHLRAKGMGGKSRLRFHPDNLIAMCGAHHIYFTNQPLTFIEFIEEIWPGRWSKLAELERTLPKGENADFWRDYYIEQGFTQTGRRKE